MSTPPGDTLTFLFTDIQGSTRLWERYTQAMHHALERHDAIVRATIAEYEGEVFKTVGDAFCAVFSDSAAACEAALATQRAIQAEEWAEVGSILVRMALHSGPAEERGGDYFGPTVNRVARLLSV